MKDEEKTKEQLVEALREGEKRLPFEFMPEEEEVLARQTAELSRANERLEEKDRLLTAFHEIGRSVLSHLDLEPMLDTLARQVTVAGIFRSLMVALVEEKTHSLRVVKNLTRDTQGGGLSPQLREDSRSIVGLVYDLEDDNISAEVARTGEMQVVEGWDDRFDLRVAKPENLRGTVAYFIPVKEGDRVLAVLATGSRIEEKEETLRRIEVMRPLLGQVAIALEHARLYEEVQNRTTQLQAANERLQNEIIERQEAEETLRQEYTSHEAEAAVRLKIAEMDQPHDLCTVVGEIGTQLHRLGVDHDSVSIQIVNNLWC